LDVVGEEGNFETPDGCIGHVSRALLRADVKVNVQV
jgi:hypothetical protein